MSVRFVKNPAFEEQHSQAPAFRKGMAAITVGVAESIKTAALPFRNTGAYIDQIGAVPVWLAGGGHLVALPRHIWHVVELGSVNNPPQANVLRGVRAAGLRYEHDAAAATEALTTAEARRAARRLAELR